MKDLLSAIRKNLVDHNYYSALFLTLTLPSICGALESSNGEDDNQKYKQWYSQNIMGLNLTAEDCYYLRCSLLHQGTTTHQFSGFSRVVFTFPVNSGNTFHDNIFNKALNLDVALFCEQVTGAVESWLTRVQGTANYEKNSKNLMCLYPNGLPPFIVGHPVIS